MFAALSYPDIDAIGLLAAHATGQGIDVATLLQLQIESTYAQYADRQSREVAELRRQEGQRIPVDLDYAGIAGLSTELRLKLARQRPETILQASRIEGVTPAALLLILAHLRKPRPALAG
jgi:tRNA uridine 5-carboxymethylaminomethyl modification enzyme